MIGARQRSTCALKPRCRIRCGRGILLVVAVHIIQAFAAADAQQYPSRPIRYIVPQAPGGSSDTLARVITQRVGESLGRQLVIDNRAGATGVIGAELVSKATPDGYTLLQAATSHATNPAMHAKLPYDSRIVATITKQRRHRGTKTGHPTASAFGGYRGGKSRARKAR